MKSSDISHLWQQRIEITEKYQKHVVAVVLNQDPHDYWITMIDFF